jgi:hypothetical protein
LPRRQPRTVSSCDEALLLRTYSVPPGPLTRTRSFGDPGTGGELGDSITWLANIPPPSPLTVMPSGTISVTVPNRL